MTPQQLRNSILQMAIEGKLTEQRAEDGNASDLLKEIKAEKAKLIAEKKIKKEKSLPEISEDEIPFEIPDNWVWTRLGDIAEVKSSKRVYESDYVSEGIPFFRLDMKYVFAKCFLLRKSGGRSKPLSCLCLL